MRNPTHSDYSRRLGPVFAEQAAMAQDRGPAWQYTEAELNKNALSQGLNGTTAKDYKPAHGGYPTTPSWRATNPVPFP